MRYEFKTRTRSIFDDVYELMRRNKDEIDYLRKVVMDIKNPMVGLKRLLKANGG